MRGLFDIERSPIHVADEDCAPHLDEADVCRICGVYAGDPCPHCGCRSFHRDDCPDAWDDGGPPPARDLVDGRPCPLCERRERHAADCPLDGAECFGPPCHDLLPVDGWRAYRHKASGRVALLRPMRGAFSGPTAGGQRWVGDDGDYLRVRHGRAQRLRAATVRRQWIAE